MNIKTIFFCTSLLFVLSNCAPAGTAFLGPAYTLSSSGSIFQTSMSYGTNRLVKQITETSQPKHVKKIKSASQPKHVRLISVEFENKKKNSYKTVNSNDYKNFINAVKSNLK